MFKNSDSGSDIEVGHMHSGRQLRKVPLVKLFKKNYKYEGFYSGEEEDLIDEEYSESARTEEVQTKELQQGEIETLGITHTIEVSTITPPLVLEELSNQRNQSSQSHHITITSSLEHTHSRNQGRSMEDEMRLPIFKGDGSEDHDHHWFLCEVVWSIR
jgi:hypothetical protein